tara:strand:- start:6423 stop:6893 length:471 start_codon:yes stop_codon:yes gene_type:complete
MIKDEDNFDPMKEYGVPTSIETFTQGGVTYQLKVWQTPEGTIKTMDIINLSDEIDFIDFDGIKNDVKLNENELDTLFDNGSPLPMGFLRLLGEAANLDEKHQERFAKLKPIELTTEEMIEQLQEDLDIAVSHEDYEGAADIKKELDALKKTVKITD